MPVPAPNTYQFDSTGQLQDNRIVNEIHTLSAVNYNDYHCIIPDFAPFYADTLEVYYRVDENSPWLFMDEGVDYYAGFQFIGASRQTALPVYGGISFNNLALSGQIRLNYNTVGGEWTLDQEKLTEMLINLVYNPRTTSWEQVSGVPAIFPPATHAWELDDLVGMTEVVDALEDIEEAILGRDQSSDLLNHLSDFNNPHKTTKSHVGLGRVMNFPPATVAETIAGDNPELYVTPVGLHAYIESLGLDAALNFVSLEEVVNRISVNKILTFDLFLLYMKLYGGQDTDPIENNTERPKILVPGEGIDHTVEDFFICNTFFEDVAGSITRTISLTGTGTHTIPVGVNTVRVTGRGAIGGQSVQPYITKTENVSGLGQGTFIIPAGGSIMSVRARGAAGVQSNTAGIYTPSGNGVLNNVPPANPAPGNPSWSFSIVSSFASNFQINGQQQNINVNLVVRKNFSNGNSFTAQAVPVSLTLANSNFSGSTLTYTGSFTSLFEDATSLSAIFEVEFTRLPGTDIIPGASATVTINGFTRTYTGSSTLAQPNLSSDDIAIVNTETTTVNYASPAGTEVEIIYQDYTANGTWAIKRYYSSLITNPSTGTSALVEDTTGTVVAFDSQITGQMLSTRNTLTTQSTAGIPGQYQLTVVTSSSNASVRVFEYNFVTSGSPVTIRVVAEFTSNAGIITSGQPAVVTILGNSLVYPGSQDNTTTPQIRSDNITLNSSFSTNIVYDCPAGASIVLVYNEPNTQQAVVHASTVWEVSTTEDFIETSTIIDTSAGQTESITLTQWKSLNPTTYVNNTTYFVRCKWIRSDQTESGWSDVREFRNIERVRYPARDTEQSRYCKGTDLWGIYADGNGGNYERLITANSSACGYVPPVSSKPISATGGDITEINCYKIHTFRDSGSFVVNDPGNIGSVVDYLIVAGGGPGGTSAGNNSTGTGAGSCGGGGGGDVIYGNTVVTKTTYNIVIGAGGTWPNNGGNSSAFNITAMGGGKGGAYLGVAPAAGGSGGGAGQTGIGSTALGASSSSGLGNKGGDCTIPAPMATGGGGGGGGAGGPGENAQSRGQPSPIHGGNGGPGASSDISGTLRYYGAGGGGGGSNASTASNGVSTPPGEPGTGGSGVGGNGATYRGGWTTAGAPNTGSGGGGGNGPERPGAKGGSGVVIIRYRSCVDEAPSLTKCIDATGGSTSEINIGGQKYRVHVFTSNGTLNVTNACGRDNIEYLLVAGGGGGGTTNDAAGAGGGGGGGGVLIGNTSAKTGAFQVIVGNGGSPANNGGNSLIQNLTPEAIGGGAGQYGSFDVNGRSGKAGGSGGGASQRDWSSLTPGGAGVFNQGNNGGSVEHNGGDWANAAAGGGGAGGPGGNATRTYIGGAGGPGKVVNFRGINETFGGGGGGGSANRAPHIAGEGGSGGGGRGADWWYNGIPGAPQAGREGIPNTGGGGGGGSGGARPENLGKAGGSGIVMVRYKIYEESEQQTRISATGGDITTYTLGGQKYRVHVFNQNGNLNVTSAGATTQFIEYMIVAGGGGGGGRGGGGGAGGVIFGQIRPGVSTYPVVVGSGGLGTVQGVRAATNGTSSSMFDLVTPGGGAGGDYRNGAGRSGGSGGGAGGADADKDNVGAVGGAGTNKQGNAGGSNPTGSYSGGGGGGAGAAGGNSSRNTGNGQAGNGGIGVQSDISGTLKYYAGGGGGSGVAGSNRGNGGNGGGGAGGVAAGIPGTANTGGGGGAGGSSGGTWSPGGDGGSGVVIVRYKID